MTVLPKPPNLPYVEEIDNEDFQNYLNISYITNPIKTIYGTFKIHISPHSKKQCRIRTFAITNTDHFSAYGYLKIKVDILMRGDSGESSDDGMGCKPIMISKQTLAKHEQFTSKLISFPFNLKANEMFVFTRITVRINWVDQPQPGHANEPESSVKPRACNPRSRISIHSSIDLPADQLSPKYQPPMMRVASRPAPTTLSDLDVAGQRYVSIIACDSRIPFNTSQLVLSKASSYYSAFFNGQWFKNVDPKDPLPLSFSKRAVLLFLLHIYGEWIPGHDIPVTHANVKQVMTKQSIHCLELNLELMQELSELAEMLGLRVLYEKTNELILNTFFTKLQVLHEASLYNKPGIIRKVETCSAYYDEDKQVLGCKHYMRSVKVQAHCCGKWVVCRFCHDEASDHAMIRQKTKRIICMHCFQIQKCSSVCANPSCEATLGHYYCSQCKFWDNDLNKQIYHCTECGICRIGKGLDLDYFHCQTCNVCMAIGLKDKHVCIRNNLKSDCPKCGEYMFTSTRTVVFMPCGHGIHHKCYLQHIKSLFTCPKCFKPLGNSPMYQ